MKLNEKKDIRICPFCKCEGWLDRRASVAEWYKNSFFRCGNCKETFSNDEFQEAQKVK